MGLRGLGIRNSDAGFWVWNYGVQSLGFRVHGFKVSGV